MHWWTRGFPRLFCLIHLVLAWLAGGWMGAPRLLAGTDEDGVSFSGDIRPLLQKYCLECHGHQERKGDVRLDQFDTPLSILSDRDLWETSLELIRAEEMPPEDPLPTAAERETLANWIDRTLHNEAWTNYRSPGAVPLPRLTLVEYRNTMRDLLGVDLEAGETLPEDGEGASGFTNDRANLHLTPAQLEKYLAAAERALEGRFALESPPRAFVLESENLQRIPKTMKQHLDGMVLANPDQSLQGQIYVPADGYYEVTVKGGAYAGDTEALVRFGGDAETSVALSGLPNLGGEFRAQVFLRKGPQPVLVSNRNLVPQAALPPDVAGRVAEAAGLHAPRLAPLSGDEREEVRSARENLNYRAVGMQDALEWLRVLGPEADSREIDRFRKYAVERTGETEAARNRLAELIDWSRADLEALWVEQNRERLEDNQRLLDAVAHVRWEDWMKYQGKAYVDRLTIRGPVWPPDQREDWSTALSLGAKPGESPEDMVGRVLTDFLPKAFRQPVGEGAAGRYLSLYESERDAGETHASALQTALAAVLVSPRFLYRTEFQPDGAGWDEEKGYALDGYALASRLSYFLWQTMPDGRLLRLAEEGRLRDPEVLSAEAGRLLEDPRSMAFVREFAGDWLGIAGLGSKVSPDPAVFPEFDQALAEAMKEETIRFVDRIFREDRPVRELIDSRETFLNESLARHYGLPPVTGDELRLVSLKGDQRGGLLGMGSILTVTSSPQRPNPVRRGKWVMETLLGDDPGEPLPDAGELPGDAGEARGRTLEEELMLHRRREDCARCHEKLDPLGLGLQNFDAVGRWRETEAGKPVESRGTLPDGTSFEGPAGLREALLTSRQEDFVKNFCGQVLSFALGRELQFYDRATVEELFRSVMKADQSPRELIRAVVRSEAFRYQAEPERPE